MLQIPTLYHWLTNPTNKLQFCERNFRNIEKAYFLSLTFRCFHLNGNSFYIYICVPTILHRVVITCIYVYVIKHINPWIITTLYLSKETHVSTICLSILVFTLVESLLYFYGFLKNTRSPKFRKKSKVIKS